MTLCLAVLFFVLTPGILVSLPKGGSKRMVAAVHAVVFALVFHLLHTMVWKGMEGFNNGLMKAVGGGSTQQKLNVGVGGGSAGQGTVPCAAGKRRNAQGVCV